MAGRPGVDGAVLSGGASRRMGRDKAHLVVNGAPMYRRVLDALGGPIGSGSLVVVGGDEDLLADSERFVMDRWPGQGPLGGIVTALTGPGTNPLVAVLSCDLLRPDADTVWRLITVHVNVDCDVAVPVAHGREQWTHAVWNRRVAPVLESRFEEGVRAIHVAVGGLDVHGVDVDGDTVADADRPEDLPPA